MYYLSNKGWIWLFVKQSFVWSLCYLLGMEWESNHHSQVNSQSHGLYVLFIYFEENGSYVFTIGMTLLFLKGKNFRLSLVTQPNSNLIIKY